MGKEKNSKEGNPPKIKDKTIVQKKKKLKVTAAILNNNVRDSDGLRNLTSSGSSTRSPAKHEKCESVNRKLRSYSHKSEPQKIVKNVNEKPPTESPSTSQKNEDEMEWESITEKEIIDTLQKIRNSEISRDFISTKSDFHPVTSTTKTSELISSASVHVVIDTNIFLSHLSIVKMLVEKGEFCRKVQVLVPWMVLQELDFMKTNRENKVKLELIARKAGTFMFEQINKKNAFFRTQTLDEFKSCINLLPDENADDKILQWCLFLKKEIGSDVTLLSNDILFCAKASANGIQTFQSDNFIQQLPQLIVQNIQQPPVSAPNQSMCVNVKDSRRHTSEASPSQTPSIQNVALVCSIETKVNAATFLHQFEKCVVDSLGQIIEFEMKHVYEDIWLQIIIVKPPWKLSDIFRCVDKHWIAVFGYVYPRDMREKIEHLRSLWLRFKELDDLEQKEREIITQSGICILQLIQRTRKQFYYTLEKAIEEIKNLINQSADLDDVFILDLFTRLWDRFNFICGTLADAVVLPHHGLQYIPGATVPSVQEASNGFQVLMPLLCSMESAMCRFFQDDNRSSAQIENNSLEISNRLVQSMKELGLQLREINSLSSLSQALMHFASEHREKMEIGLKQLRVYIQVLHSVSVKFEIPPKI